MRARPPPVQIAKIAGKRSSEAQDLLGFIGSQFVVDRNNVAMLVRDMELGASK